MGTLPSLEAFYALLNTNSSDWEVIEGGEPDVIDAQGAETWNQQNSASSLQVRDEPTCDARTGWDYLICQVMPNNAIKWSIGAGLLIWYAPEILDKWLDKLALLVYNGFNLAERYARQHGGGEGPAKLTTRDGLTEAEFIHFKVEEPLGLGLNSRHLSDDGSETDLSLFSNWVFNSKSGELYVQGVGGNFASSLSAGTKKMGLDSRQTDDYNILITVSRVSFALPSAEPGCIRQTLRYFLDRSSGFYAHCCQPMHNSGNWLSNVGVHINEGRYNSNVPRNCC
jgi:hypothetical protein